MFIDLDFTKKPQKPQLFIAKPNREIIGKLKESYDKKLTLSLSELNELSFSIPYKIDIRNALKDNPNINKIKDRYLIKLVLGNYTEWYIINNITDGSNEEGDIKQVHAYSLGHELNDKLITGYKCTSYNITQVSADILSSSIWSIGYVDATFETTYRSFEFSLNKTLECIYKIAETFGALVVWDTENRLINFYKFDLYGTDKGLINTEDKYLKALHKDSNADEMVTRLKVYGRDNLSIQKVNPTGANYIEDFSYFMYPFERDENKNVLQHSDYMSDGLCHAILDYRELVEENTETFGDLLGQKNILLAEKASLESQLYSLQEQLYVILDNLDVAQAQGTSTTQLKQQRNSKQLEIEDKLAEINNVDDEIDDVDSQIADLKNILAIENNFAPEQIIERDQFIIEKEWRDENYIDEMDLYNEAMRRFEQLREPQVAYELDVVDFLSVVAEQRDWHKLNLGDVIRIRHSRLNIDIKTKIIKIDFDNSGIKLTIANSKKIISDENKYWESFYKSVSTSTTVDMNKFKWAEATDKVSIINQVLDNTWESAERTISAGVNESVTIDRRGITITDPTDPLKYLRLTHGVLGLTNDGGNTYKQAITGEGILADAIICSALYALTSGDGYTKLVEDGLHVYDENNTDRVHVGRWLDGLVNRFGLKVVAEDGQTTLLDDRGILQTWQEGRADNVDESYGLVLNVYIPAETREIRKALLRFKLEAFRAYSKGNSSGGDSAITSRTASLNISTTGSAAIHMVKYTDEAQEGGDVNTRTSSGGYHNHGVTQGTGLVKADGGTVWFNNENTSHTHPIPSHYHRFTIYDYDSEHGHDINIPSHKHNVDIPSHTHSINYGIYTSTTAIGVTIKINGTDRTSELGGSFSSSQNGINIAQYLTTGQWNTIELGSTRLGRIDAAVFIQALMGT